MKKTFDLEDLSPRGCYIQVEIGGEYKKFALKKFSLMAQIWVREEWGSERAWAEALDDKSELNQKTGGLENIKAICKTAHFLLEDKETFPTWQSLAEAIGSGPNEVLNLGRALMECIGMSQPIIDNAIGDAKKKIKKGVKNQSAGTK